MINENEITYFHADWTEEGNVLRGDEKAKILADVLAHLAVPANDIASRLRGQVMLFNDSANCMEKRFDCKKMQYVSMSVAESVKVKNYKNLADLLTEAADFIEGMPK